MTANNQFQYHFDKQNITRHSFILSGFFQSPHTSPLRVTATRKRKPDYNSRLAQTGCFFLIYIAFNIYGVGERAKGVLEGIETTIESVEEDGDNEKEKQWNDFI